MVDQAHENELLNLSNAEIVYHDIVLSEGLVSSWDSNGAAWVCARTFDDKKIYLYYTGFSDMLKERTSRHNIGIAVSTSHDSIQFTKYPEPILELPEGTVKAWTPNVFRVGNRFFMLFAFKRGKRIKNSIGIAVADDPQGPFRFIKTVLVPSDAWEGYGVDLGSCAIKVNENTFLFYYSNYISSITSLIKNFVTMIKRKHLGGISIKDWYRYVRRSIGIAKIKVYSGSRNDIYLYKYENNPLTALNGSWGSWRESVFCPGCLVGRKKHYLFLASSVYSIGFPYKQYIGLVTSSSPYFYGIDQEVILLDENRVKKSLNLYGDGVAFDTPSPLVCGDRILLFYSLMNRRENVWRTALLVLKPCTEILEHCDLSYFHSE